MHSRAENLDAKPGWRPCSWVLSKLTAPLCLFQSCWEYAWTA